MTDKKVKIVEDTKRPDYTDNKFVKEDMAALSHMIGKTVVQTYLTWGFNTTIIELSDGTGFSYCHYQDDIEMRLLTKEEMTLFKTKRVMK